MNDSISFHLKALELLKYWSSMLQFIEIVVFISIIILIVFGNPETIRQRWRSLYAAILFTTLSIVFGLNVLGTLPWSMQQLPKLYSTYGDIYQFPNFIGIPVWIIAFAQHLNAVIGFACLLYLIFIILRQVRQK